MKPIKIKLKKLNENAQLPIKSKEGDLCYDVYAVDEEEVAPNVWRYKLGFSYEIVRDKITLENYDTVKCGGGLQIDLVNSPIVISIDFRPRSSIWKTGMVLANSEGTLDEFYRGEAMAVFYHVIKELPRYTVGERIGQIKLGFSYPCEFEFVNEVNESTERGSGGFGSTGNN